MSFSWTLKNDRSAFLKPPFGRIVSIKILLLVACFSCALPARTDDGAEPILTARPGLCILKEEGDSNCEMAVELIWNTAVSDNFCLYSSASVGALQCWQAAREGQHHFELSSPQGVEFWLQRRGSEKKLAKITLRIVSLSQRNPQRRRRRHVWSVL